MVAYALGATVNSAERSTFFILQFVIPCALASIVAPRERRSKDTASAAETYGLDAGSKKAVIESGFCAEPAGRRAADKDSPNDPG